MPRPSPSVRKLLIGALLVGLFLLYSSVGERGLLRLSRMLSLRSDLRQQVTTLERENALLGQEVNRLREDPAAIEELARSRGMGREGEVIYILPQVEETAR